MLGLSRTGSVLPTLRAIPRVSASLLHTTPSSAVSLDDSHRFVVVGGGAGGLAVGSWIGRKYGAENLAIVEPATTHYYQPMFTLVGGGAKPLDASRRPMASLMPPEAKWVKSSVTEFHPDENYVVTADGKKMGYDYLVVALGLDIKYNAVKGLQSLLDDPLSKVSTNYSALYAPKTFQLIQSFQGGNAIFTMPPLPIKCPGAPQKIMYLAEDYWRKHGMRDRSTVMYNSALGVIFGVKKYADSLMKVIRERGIQVNFQRKLMEVTKDEAIFDNTDECTTETYKYDLIHVTPPQGPLEFMKDQPICDEAGWVSVDKTTLQNPTFPNVFAIGDCTNVPASKTAAAVAAESAVLRTNIAAVVKGLNPSAHYDGYASCPLITGYGKTILAEFDFNANPLETFPFDQGKERRSMYHLKKDVMPDLYWMGLVKGIWGGPATARKLLHLGTKE